MTKNSHAKKSKNCHTEEKKSKKYFHSFDAKKNLYHLRFKIIVALLNTIIIPPAFFNLLKKSLKFF